jgi:hypothetical protein
MVLAKHFNRILVAAFIVLGIAAASGAFAVGYTRALSESLTNPASAPLLRLAALARLDDSLGYAGVLRTYREFLSTGGRSAKSALQRLADESDASLGAFLSASVSAKDRQAAASLRNLAAPFKPTALFGTGAAETRPQGLASFPDLERAYAALKTEIAKAADSANRDRLDRVSGVFFWAETILILALSLIAAMLFALAWYLHGRVIVPLEALRSSVNGAAAGAMGEAVWGVGRKDEIGGLARAAERLRQAAAMGTQDRFAQVSERTKQGIQRLEADLERVAAAATDTQTKIEGASARAAKASQAAIEAAGLAREGAARLAMKAEETIEAAGAEAGILLTQLTEIVARLSGATAQFEMPKPRQQITDAKLSARAATLPAPKETARDAIVEDLIADLEALERFSRERKDLATDEAVALTASLIEAIDRLNAVANRICASADESAKRAAG